MANIASVQRSRTDACPGALTVHQAADGGLARVRLPGGAVTATQLRTLADATRELGDGRLELTSRGNVQLRALGVGAEIELGQRLADVGLLPSRTHERVRNIVASPLADIDGPSPVPVLAQRLDHALCAIPRLAQLPGRFLFALDDGRGDLVDLGADVLLQFGPGAATVNGLDVGAGIDPVEVLIEFALAFLDERAAQGSAAWRISELADGLAAVRDRVQSAYPQLSPARRPGSHLARLEPVGPVAQPDGQSAVVALAPLGRLRTDQLDGLASLTTGRPARITPWRSIVVPDQPDARAAVAELERLALGVDSASPWYRLSACTGRPGCVEALADVQADAARAAAAGTHAGRVVHWSGCARRCGRPVATEIDIVATTAGYAVSDREPSDG